MILEPRFVAVTKYLQKIGTQGVAMERSTMQTSFYAATTKFLKNEEVQVNAVAIRRMTQTLKSAVIAKYMPSLTQVKVVAAVEYRMIAKRMSAVGVKLMGPRVTTHAVG